jgi:hypothetical protein
MLRISAFIAVLALIGTTGVSTAQVQSNSAQKGWACYNSQTCQAQCNAAGYRYCELWCQRQASTKPACK